MNLKISLCLNILLHFFSLMAEAVQRPNILLVLTDDQVTILKDKMSG